MFYKITIVCAILTLVESKHIKGIQIKNVGQERLWVEMTDEDGFFLPAGQLASIVVEDHWSGYIRAQRANCKSIYCNTTLTVAFFKFQGEENFDRYHVSIADGFNKPIKIQPTNFDPTCKLASCRFDIPHNCPSTHHVKTDEGVPIACKFSPELFPKLCPRAVTSESDYASNTFSCKSNTYAVYIG